MRYRSPEAAVRWPTTLPTCGPPSRPLHSTSPPTGSSAPHSAATLPRARSARRCPLSGSGAICSHDRSAASLSRSTPGHACRTSATCSRTFHARSGGIAPGRLRCRGACAPPSRPAPAAARRSRAQRELPVLRTLPCPGGTEYFSNNQLVCASGVLAACTGGGYGSRSPSSLEDASMQRQVKLRRVRVARQDVGAQSSIWARARGRLLRRMTRMITTVATCLLLNPMGCVLLLRRDSNCCCACCCDKY